MPEQQEDPCIDDFVESFLVKYTHRPDNRYMPFIASGPKPMMRPIRQEMQRGRNSQALSR